MRRMSGSIATVDQENDLTYVKGYMLLIGAILFVVWELYALLFSKLMPYTGNWFLDAIKDDLYYTPLLTGMIMFSVFFVIVNWMALKFFRHN
eukprot:TRINITY_DN15531_c0_g1_i1.p2 TRINITY_DN15531_c0_g1~~TRINITY_DN15531_c0_g1_i1.p2  ORF type:complete len:105 (+),score=36.16 TRINITY_DN15531_c0_g1_i1:42-317(+)